MSSKLKAEITIFRQAHLQLVKSLEQKKNEFIRDSAIKRFEFTFELFWKALKLYAEFEGKSANSPRSAIREAFSLGLISPNPQFFQMLEDRNNSSHAYKQSLAEDIYSRLSGHSELMLEIIKKIEKNIEGN